MTESDNAAPPIETVTFDDDYIDHPFIPSLEPQDVKEFLKAFAAAQADYTPVLREKEVVITPRAREEGGRAPAPYKFKYAELANVIEATRALAKNGISVSQPVHQDRANKLWLYTIVAHASGAGRVTRMSLYGDKELKTFGGEITYLRRYCLAPAVGVASEDDADANGDGGGGDDEGFRRQREEETGPPPAVRRQSAVRKTTPAGAERTEAKPQTATAKVKPGQAKNLILKIGSLGWAPDGPEVLAMLTELNVPEISDDMATKDWAAVMNALNKAAK